MEAQQKIMELFESSLTDFASLQGELINHIQALPKENREQISELLLEVNKGLTRVDTEMVQGAIDKMKDLIK